MGSGVEAGIEFLSDEWLAAADAALGSLSPLPVPVVVGYVVGGGPDGERRHRVVLGPGRVGAARGTEGATTVMTLAWELAVAVSQGRVSAQQAFLDGEIELTGDPVTLLGHQDRLTAVDDVLAPLRARTVYPAG